MALSPLAYAVMVGGDYMTMGRLLLPALPFSVLLLGVLIHVSMARFPRRLVLGTMVLVLLAGVAPAFDLHLVPASLRAPFHFRQRADIVRSEYQQWRFQRGNVTRWRKRAQALNQVTTPGDSLVTGEIGVLGYDSGLFIYDISGLVSREVAERSIRGRRDKKSPGHEKECFMDIFSGQRAHHPSGESAER